MFSERRSGLHTADALNNKIHSCYAASILGYVKYYFHMFGQFKFKVTEIIFRENRLFWKEPEVIC